MLSFKFVYTMINTAYVYHSCNRPFTSDDLIEEKSEANNENQIVQSSHNYIMQRVPLSP